MAGIQQWSDTDNLRDLKKSQATAFWMQCRDLIAYTQRPTKTFTAYGRVTIYTTEQLKVKGLKGPAVEA